MKQYLIEKEIPQNFSETPECIVPFIAAAGAKYNFAWDMVNYMTKYKKETRQPVTPEELNMMHEANAFYQNMYHVPDEVVLYIPKGLETITDCSVAFRKPEMQDIDKAIGTFRTAVEIYVPAFREYQKSACNTKAIVKGK